MAVARLDQQLLKKISERTGRSPQSIRERVSRRANRSGVHSEVALISLARELGIGTGRAVRRLPVYLQQQLSAPGAAPTARAADTSRPSQRSKAGNRPRRRKPRSGSKIDVFISHSSPDAAVAERLVKLLRAALNVPAEKIRCTSLAGYRLPAGADTDDALREEVFGSRAFIGVITRSSWKSAYVLFELGARWGAGKHLAPLMAGDMDPSQLRGPLAGINALSCKSSGELHQLVGDIGETLSRKVERPEVFEKEIQSLLRASKIADQRQRGRRR